VDNAQIVWNSSNGDEVLLAINQPGNISLSATALNKYEAQSDTGFMYVNVHEYPQALVSSDTTICEETTIQLNASGGVIYAWLPDSSLLNSNTASPFASPIENTNYSVEISNGFCAVNDTVRVEVLPKPFISAGNDVIICKGDTGTLNAWVQGGAFYWTPSSNLESPNFFHSRAWPPVTTNYTLTTIDTNGCENSDIAVVYVLDLPEQPPVFQTQDGLTTIVGYSYQWLYEGQYIAGATNYDLTPNEEGNYAVQVTDSNGCSSTSEVFYYTVGLEETSLISVEVFPNPSEGKVVVEWSEPLSGRAKIIDLTGRVVYAEHLMQSRSMLNLHHLPAGSYHLQMDVADKIYTSKIFLY
jgi:hypothetical protein